MAKGLDYKNRSENFRVNTSQDPKTTNSGQGYKRTSDTLVSVQLMGTIAAIAFGFVGFQWQVSTLVASQASTNTRLSEEIRAMREDVSELKAEVRQLSQDDHLRTN
jgi:hypothetical protein